MGSAVAAMRDDFGTGHMEVHDKTLHGPDGWRGTVATLVLWNDETGQGCGFNLSRENAEALHAALGKLLTEAP